MLIKSVPFALRTSLLVRVVLVSVDATFLATGGLVNINSATSTARHVGPVPTNSENISTDILWN